MGFDEINQERIFNLFRLKGRCLSKSEKLRASLLSKFQFCDTDSYSDFYLSMADVTDVLLVYFLNDEVTASLENRGPLTELVEQAILKHCKNSDLEYVSVAARDLEPLFKERTNFIIGSCFADFGVSSYSVVEYWTSRIYEELREKSKPGGKKAKQLERLIKEYNQSELRNRKTIVEKIMNSCGSYVSGAEKIDFVLSKIKAGYARDISADRALLNVCRNKRNSIHNLGVHMGESLDDFKFGSTETLLERGKYVYTDDYSSYIYHCEELVDMYEHWLDITPLDKLETIADVESI